MVVAIREKVLRLGMRDAVLVIAAECVVARNWWWSFQTQYNFVFSFIFRWFFKHACVIAGGAAAPAELNKERRTLLAVVCLFECVACVM